MGCLIIMQKHKKIEIFFWIQLFSNLHFNNMTVPNHHLPCVHPLVSPTHTHTHTHTLHKQFHFFTYQVKIYSFIKRFLQKKKRKKTNKLHTHSATKSVNTKISANGKSHEIIQNIYKHIQFFLQLHGREKDNEDTRVRMETKFSLSHSSTRHFN